MVLQCQRHQLEDHLEKSMKSHLDLSMTEISRLRRVRFMKKSVFFQVEEVSFINRPNG